ncbi:MAG: ComEA family DNA-binding protein [Marinomonas sp.]
MNITQCIRALLRCSLLIFVLSPFSLLAAEPLDINTATADQFAAVMSGVGEKKAQAIIAYRDKNGPFKTVDQLVEVKGLGDALLERNRPLIQVIEIRFPDKKTASD